MSVLFIYTNRFRRVCEDFSRMSEAAICNLHFCVNIPEEIDYELAEANRHDAPWPNTTTCRGMSIRDFMNFVRDRAVEGDTVVADWDSGNPKYYKRTAKTLKSIKQSDLPLSVQVRIEGMKDRRLSHLCYGEAIPVGVYSIRNDRPFHSAMPSLELVADVGQQLWAIDRGEYLVESGMLICRACRSALKGEISNVPSEVLANPSVLGVSAYVVAETGHFIDREENWQVLVKDVNGDYMWIDHDDDEVMIVDGVFRRRNPDLREIAGDEPVLYGDFTYDENAELRPVPVMSYHDVPAEGFSVARFMADSVIGRVEHIPSYYRLSNRSAMDNCREAFPGYRFLNRDDHVQEGDWLVRPNGTIHKPDCIGKKLHENSTTLIRPIGMDGWGVLVRDQITDDMEVEWQVRDRGKVCIDWTPWDLERDNDKLSEYERQYYTVYFRKRVHGFRVRCSGDPNFPLPFGMEWVPEGERLSAGYTELVGQEFREILPSHVGRLCAEPYIYARATLSSFHGPLPTPSVMSHGGLSVEYIGPFPGGNPSSLIDEWQMFVSQHGLSMVPVRANTTKGQEAPIGTFWPCTFKINGQSQIIYCTDKVGPNQLEVLVRRGLVSVLGAVQRHLPFFNVVPATPQVQGRREVRAIQL